MAKEALCPAHEDAPGGSCRSPRPVSLGALPSNQQLGQGGEERAIQLLPGRPRQGPIRSCLVLFDSVTMGHSGQ